MPNMNVTTKSVEKVWTAPDGKMSIHKLVLDYNGKQFAAKTYSSAIATPGWSGEIETYEKQGRNGSETFVKQPQKEGGFRGGGAPARTQDTFTMYLSYAKDLVVAELAADRIPKTQKHNDLIQIILGTAYELYENRPDAPEKATKDNVTEVFGEETTVTDDEINQVDEAIEELPL